MNISKQCYVIFILNIGIFSCVMPMDDFFLTSGISHENKEEKRLLFERVVKNYMFIKKCKAHKKRRSDFGSYKIIKRYGPITSVELIQKAKL